MFRRIGRAGHGSGPRPLWSKGAEARRDGHRIRKDISKSRELIQPKALNILEEIASLIVRTVK